MQSEYENWSCYAKVYDPIKIGSIDATDAEPHDKAIIRSINNSYRPNKHVKGRPECTIFVSRLNFNTTKETIQEVFSKFGRIRRFRLVKDIVTGMPKGYAFIEYESKTGAEAAYCEAYKMNIDGRVIFVDFECERLLKGWKPRRLGGGFGGRKESGQLRFGGRDKPFKKPITLELKEREERTKKRREKNSGDHRRSRSGERDLKHSRRRRSLSTEGGPNSSRREEHRSRHSRHQEDLQSHSRRKEN